MLMDVLPGVFSRRSPVGEIAPVLFEIPRSGAGATWLFAYRPDACTGLNWHERDMDPGQLAEDARTRRPELAEIRTHLTAVAAKVAELAQVGRCVS
jgi:hypothetical protein